MAAPFAAPDIAGAAPLVEEREQVTGVQTAEDRYSHITARVFINGQGPFHFLVDTGANRSAIDEGLAQRLGLPVGSDVAVNTVLGARNRPTVLVDQLRIGGRLQHRVSMPTLAITGIAADGVLGVDWLKNRRLTFHFGDRKLEIAGPAVGRGLPSQSGVLLTAKLQSGQLSLVDARVAGRPVAAMIDTGAQSTLGNRALQAMVSARRGFATTARPVGINTVTGERIDGEELRVADVRLGGALFRQAPVIFADLRLFELWGMQSEPAMVLGLDMIGMFDRVTLDYSRKQVLLELEKRRGKA